MMDPSMMGGAPPGAPPMGGGGPPPELMALLQGGGQPQQTSQDPLPHLQQAIQHLHDLVAILPDPKHTQVATQALLALTRVQSELMQPAGAPPGAQGGYGG